MRDLHGKATQAFFPPRLKQPAAFLTGVVRAGTLRDLVQDVHSIGSWARVRVGRAKKETSILDAVPLPLLPGARAWGPSTQATADRREYCTNTKRHDKVGDRRTR